MATPVPQMLAKPVPKKPTVTNAVSGVVPKANIPTAPTSEQSAHQAWINDPSSGQGGMDNYVKTQNQRWQAANQSNDTDLIGKLQADSQRVGYTLNPYSAPSPEPTAPSTPTQSSAPTQTPTQNTAQQSYFQYQKQLNDAMKQLQGFMKPMNYDPNTDPTYLTQKKLYENQAKQASQRAMEALNERGVLNSTMTAGEIADSEQNAALQSDALAAQLQDKAYQRQQDQINNTTRVIGLLGDMEQRGLDNDYRSRTFDRGVLESDRNFNRGVTESDRNYDRGVFENDREYSRQVSKDGAESARYADEIAYKRQQDEIKNGQWDKTFDLEMQKWADDKGLKWANFDLETKKTLANIALEQQRNAISQQNANTSSASAANSANNAKERLELDRSRLSEGNVAQLTNTLNQTYGTFNEDGKFTGIDSNKSSQLRQAIINMNLPDYQTDQLLASYGLPTN